MSRKVHPTLIGGFVIGAIALLAAGVAMFGGAELFAERRFYQAYFDEQTNGLRVGSNILMNGVRIGHVTDIDLLVDELSYEALTRVTMEIFSNTLILTRDGVPIGEAMREDVSQDLMLNEAGLRAQLGLESFITGQLRIELEFHPDKPPLLRGKNTEYPEIPTIPSSVQQLLAKAREWFDNFEADVDIGEISERLGNILVGLDELVNSDHVRASLEGIDLLVNDADTRSLAASLKSTLDKLSVAAADASTLFNTANDDIGTIADHLRPALTQLNSALGEAEQTLAAARVHLRGDTEQMYQLEVTLTQVESAARALREFFDYLERNPEALLRGK